VQLYKSFVLIALARVPNALEVEPPREVTNVEFWDAIRMSSQDESSCTLRFKCHRGSGELSRRVGEIILGDAFSVTCSKSRDEGAPIVSRVVFKRPSWAAFPHELREAKVREFLNLKQNP
ncbi:hypothetical protein H5410_040706, partial [Solanum commersonii]